MVVGAFFYGSAALGWDLRGCLYEVGRGKGILHSLPGGWDN